MKDHLYIKNNVFYFGRLNTVEDVQENSLLFSQLNSIHANRINTICFDAAKKRIIIVHDKNRDEAIIQLESNKLLEQYYTEILHLFPYAVLLDEDKTKFHLIRKPLIGIAVIVVIFILAASRVSSTGTSVSGKSLNGILSALASMGIGRLLALTVVLLFIPLLGIHFKIKSVKNKRILSFRN